MESTDLFELDPSARLIIPGHVLLRRVEDETVLLNVADEHHYGLDGVGTRTLELAGEGMSIGTLLDTLEREYEVKRAVLEADLLRLIRALHKAGLIELVRP